MTPSTLAVIPARGGSKGLPRKNLRQLAGRPLLSFTIEAAKNSRLDRVILSTDSEEIADIGRKYGAEVPFMRPAELARDQSSSLSVLLHALHWVRKHDRFFPDVVALLQPTSPLRTAEHINEGLDILSATGARSVIGISPVEEIHPYYMFTLAADFRLRYIMDVHPRPMRRQDLPPVYRINGALYLTRSDYYDLPLEPDAPVYDATHLVGLPMDAVSSIDINTLVDLEQAEALLRQRSQSS
ncbi:acylneuraminate cytidylyltransferase family protein [bacterium]|nr:acylneuraminate cytidylyltransferase family protein [bacterium]